MAATSLLDRPLYTCPDVDRLVGLTSGTARRWLEGHRRAGRSYPPVLRQEATGGDLATWGELVEARLLSGYRRRNVPMHRLRPAVERLRAEFGPNPLAQARTFHDVAGRELVMRVQCEVALSPELQIVVVRGGQTVLDGTAARFASSVRWSGGVAADITPSPVTPGVVIDPLRAAGFPALRGRGLRTDSLASDYRAGESREAIAELYELTSQEVEQALRYEMIRSRRRRS